MSCQYNEVWTGDRRLSILHAMFQTVGEQPPAKAGGFACGTCAAPLPSSEFYFDAMAVQSADEGSVLAVQVMPSGEVAAAVLGPIPPLTAQKTLPFHAMATQVADEGSVLAVQVMPSGEVAAVAPLSATAQKTLPFHAIAVQKAEEGSVLAVQVMPSGEVAAFVL